MRQATAPRRASGTAWFWHCVAHQRFRRHHHGWRKRCRRRFFRRPSLFQAVFRKPSNLVAGKTTPVFSKTDVVRSVEGIGNRRGNPFHFQNDPSRCFNDPGSQPENRGIFENDRGRQLNDSGIRTDDPSRLQNNWLFNPCAVRCSEKSGYFCMASKVDQRIPILCVGNERLKLTAARAFLHRRAASPAHCPALPVLPVYAGRVQPATRQ
jgi:hypothetical protein